MAVRAQGKPCYRCLFEDIPAGGVANCAEAGVMGPVVGIVSAIQVDLALALLAGEAVDGEVVTFDGRLDQVRRRSLRPRAGCALCGQSCRIRRIEPDAYASPAYAG
jgi:molybdopterin/thiamine biosynthesis adenylyltransferase